VAARRDRGTTSRGDTSSSRATIALRRPHNLRRQITSASGDAQLAHASFDEFALAAPALQQKARGASELSRLTSVSPRLRSSAPALRSATTMMPAPAAEERSVEPTTVVLNPSLAAAWREVERFALGDACGVVDGTHHVRGVAPRKRGVRRPAPGSDDGDLAHAVRYCNTRTITGRKAAVVTGGRAASASRSRKHRHEGASVVITG
jgi:hypothetical protein